MHNGGARVLLAVALELQVSHNVDKSCEEHGILLRHRGRVDRQERQEAQGQQLDVRGHAQ
jgi:hypothetical protein